MRQLLKSPVNICIDTEDNLRDRYPSHQIVTKNTPKDSGESAARLPK
ncbi:MAG: hypothetical protein KME60_29355 [Cyanomargarita calcarea GSE-NOS-MK-12-04C]|uniref:Uncharacterized protein n=1 Tax=Cyanomargarita calcarea GSE-NOS-MK-12-04C TaxID=2839659 RepID=A0A951QSN3_9CYAN|nr:hypothetical protein [Cyanomargarita calcarea GSE-NOS-MK-12-04C]